MKKQRVTVVLAFIMFFAVVALTKEKLVYSATDSVSIYEIDYEAETLTIKVSEKDTKVFFASSLTASNWDEVYGTIKKTDNAIRIITMDISWASKSSNVSFYIKGDVSSTPIKVTLPKQPTNFKVSLNMTSNTVNFSNLGGITKVYWRKSTSDVWNSLDTLDTSDMDAFNNELERFSLQGIKLYFRTAQVIGNVNHQGSRPSKETLLSISKRAAAPTTVKIDYSKLSITVKNTMEYKNSADDVWIPITGSSLNFSDVASELLYDDEVTQKVESISLDFRIKATSSKPASISKTIILNAQENTEISNIKTQYTGSTQLKISIEDEKDSDGDIIISGASSENPYEYTIVKPDTVFNIEKAVWTSITTTNAITITSTNAPEGSVIYVRKKATSEKPAAAYQKITINKYPTAASLKEKAELYKISGLDNDNLIFTVLVPFEDTTISSITFEGKTAKFKASSTVKNENGYLVTVTITDITAIENVTSNIDNELAGKITLNNGDVIQSGVTLYIYPAATVSGDNKVIYKDIKCEEDIELSVSLGHETKKDKEVSSIKINDKPISFIQTNDTENEYTKIVTIKKEYLDLFTKNITSAQLGNAYKIVVELNNGEVITSNVTVTTKLIASVSSSTTGMGISISSYLENKAEIEKAKEDAKNSENGSTVTVAPLFENPVLTVTIDPALYAKDDSYIVSSVNWEGLSIISSYVMNKNVITITLDISKVVAIDMKDGKSYSSPVSIMIKSVETGNEVAITSAYKITVVE